MKTGLKRKEPHKGKRRISEYAAPAVQVVMLLILSTLFSHARRRAAVYWMVTNDTSGGGFSLVLSAPNHNCTT